MAAQDERTDGQPANAKDAQGQLAHGAAAQGCPPEPRDAEGSAPPAEASSAPAAAPDAAAAPSPRRSREGLAIAVTILVVAIVAAAIAYNALAPQFAVEDGATQQAASTEPQEAPALAVQDAQGATVQLSQMRGKPVVLNFWASTCGPCQSEMPGFQQAWERYGDELEFMMVDIPGFNGETAERALAFVEANGYGFPVYFDADGSASAAYGLSSLPRTCFIDAEGRLVATAMGALSEERLAEGIALLLEGA